MSRPRTLSAPNIATDDLIARAFACAPDAMVVSSPARRIVSANAAACALFGYAAADFAGLPARALYGPEEDWAAVGNALAGASHAPVTASLRTRSGGLFDAVVSVAAILDDSGRPCGAVETFRISTIDSGSRIDAPAAAPPATSSAMRLARGVAHDFNNLLAIITGNVQLAGRKAPDGPMKTYLREAELACNMGARLTRRLTAFAEDRQLAASPLAIAAVLEAQRPLLARTLADSAALVVTIADDAGLVMADRSALENAILNLVLNARDAMPAGGTVTISVATAVVASQDRQIPLEAGNYVRLAVIDTGTGMPPGIVARAFDPFFTTKPPGRGTGLGLASVYGFAKQSGGAAVIDSAPGRGTTVSIYLPVAPSAPLHGQQAGKA